MELEEAQQMNRDRIPCQFCNRKFVPESFLKHTKVCEKTSHKKRKAFDSAKQRIQGTELAEFLPAMIGKKSELIVNVQLKEKQTPLVKATIDNSHSVPSRKNTKITSPLSKSSNYEKCPYCDRSFGPKAFDRHVEWCKEQSIRINMQSSATQEAKERLEARTKYRAPSFRSRRSMTREKYSPKVSVQENGNIINKLEERREKNSYKQLEIDNKNKMNDKCKPKEKETNFIRQNVLRCSYRNKLPKKSDNKTEKDMLNNNLQTRRKPDLNGVQTWIAANGTKIRPSLPSSKLSHTGYNKQFVNVLNDTYNPYILAEHQMKELFNDVNTSMVEEPFNQTYTLNQYESESPPPSKEEKRHKFNNKENISYDHSGPVKTTSCQTEQESNKSEKNFKTSPTSAFSRYTNGNLDANIVANRTATPIPSPYDEEKTEEIFLPPITATANAAVASAKQDTHHDTNINRYPLISLSNLSLCSSVSIDIPDERTKSCKSAVARSEMGEVAVPQQRSVSASNADKTNKNLVKKNLRMENLLYGTKDQQSDSNSTYTCNNGNKYTSKYDEKLEKLNSLLDGDSFDLMKSFTEFEHVLQNSCLDNGTFNLGSESPIGSSDFKLDRGDIGNNKLNIDSAYNSLNRKSPALSESQTFYGKTSTPEVDTLKSSTYSLPSDFQDLSQDQKLSKYCHECGAKYPLDIAKFCCECGVRRLVL